MARGEGAESQAGRSQAGRVKRTTEKGTVSGRQWGANGGFRAGEWFIRAVISGVLNLATM